MIKSLVPFNRYYCKPGTLVMPLFPSAVIFLRSSFVVVIFEKYQTVQISISFFVPTALCGVIDGTS